jgi:hypothetical protein
MRTTKLVIPVIVLLAACDADILSPTGKSLPAAAARSVSTFTTWPVSPSQISMSWPDNSPNEAGWEVHRSTTGTAGVFNLVASLAANTTSYDNTGLAQLTEYCYKVRSFKKNGPNTSYAAFTNVWCSKTFGPPPAPSGLSAVPRPYAIDVSWTNNDITYLRLEHSADQAGPWTVVATFFSATSYVDYYRPIEQPACYRVIATNSHGESPPSNVDCTAPPQPPSNNAASANGQGIDVTWTDASNVEDGYELQHALEDFVWTVIANLPADASSYRHVEVAPNVRNWYRVRAKKDGGFSDFSGQAWAAVASMAAAPPTMGGVNPSGSTRAAIYWSNVSSTTTSLRFERSTDGQASWVTAGSSSVDNYPFVDDGRTPEREVCYRIFARNSFGESGPSGVDCTRPPAYPTNVEASYQDDGSTLVTWTDNSNVEEGFEVSVINCTYYDCYYDFRNAGPNVTRITLGAGDYFDAVYAYADGGFSDPGTVGAEGASRTLSGPGVRPTRGARAPRPAAAARR